MFQPSPLVIKPLSLPAGPREGERGVKVFDSCSRPARLSSSLRSIFICWWVCRRRRLQRTPFMTEAQHVLRYQNAPKFEHDLTHIVKPFFRFFQDWTKKGQLPIYPMNKSFPFSFPRWKASIHCILCAVWIFPLPSLPSFPYLQRKKEKT